MVISLDAVFILFTKCSNIFFQVRVQHTERAIDFLVKELKVCTQKEANERIFFVSAKEALQARLQEQKGQPSHSKNKTTRCFKSPCIPVRTSVASDSQVSVHTCCKWCTILVCVTLTTCK
jgi:hypothetical protein